MKTIQKNQQKTTNQLEILNKNSENNTKNLLEHLHKTHADALKNLNAYANQINEFCKSYQKTSAQEIRSINETRKLIESISMENRESISGQFETIKDGINLLWNLQQDQTNDLRQFIQNNLTTLIMNIISSVSEIKRDSIPEILTSINNIEKAINQQTKETIDSEIEKVIKFTKENNENSLKTLQKNLQKDLESKVNSLNIVYRSHKLLQSIQDILRDIVKRQSVLNNRIDILNEMQDQVMVFIKALILMHDDIVCLHQMVSNEIVITSDNSRKVKVIDGHAANKIANENLKNSFKAINREIKNNCAKTLNVITTGFSVTIGNILSGILFVENLFNLGEEILFNSETPTEDIEVITPRKQIDSGYKSYYDIEAQETVEQKPQKVYSQKPQKVYKEKELPFPERKNIPTELREFVEVYVSTNERLEQMTTSISVYETTTQYLQEMHYEEMERQALRRQQEQQRVSEEITEPLFTETVPMIENGNQVNMNQMIENELEPLRVY